MKAKFAPAPFILLALLVLLGAPLFSQTPSQLTANDARIEQLIRQMTLEEKAGQMSLLQPFGRTPGEVDALITKGAVGAISPSFDGVEETNRQQRLAVEKSRLHIPLLIGLDVIHGHRTVFPVPLALAGSFDMDLVRDVTRVAAAEAKAESINWVFAPMLDVSRDARWGRIVESPGEDTFLATRVAEAYVAGFQGKSLAGANSVAASAKHFAGYGAAESGRDYNTVDLSERTLRAVYLPPFQAAVKAGSAAVMSAFHSLNGVPVTANHHLLSDVLRGEWGLEGFVVSDAGAIGELKKHGVAMDDAEAGHKAVLAGVDMDLGNDIFWQNVPALVRAGKLPEARVDEAVRRVLRVKFALGLFEHPYGSQRAEPYALAEKRRLARESVHESLVLLKNDAAPGGRAALPLAAQAKIALVGPLADAAAQMMGPWAVVGDAADVISLKQALQERVAHNGGALRYAKGCEILGERERMAHTPSVGEFTGKPEPDIPENERLKGQQGFAEAVAAAKASDVVVLALGEDRTMSGEAGSRANLNLPGEQQALMEAMVATGKPVVLLVFSGRPLALPWAEAHVPAIAEAWYPGVEAGPGIVDVLYGDVSPSGHLAASFPRSVGQVPIYYSRLNTGRPPEGIDVTHPPMTQMERFYSRYIDEQNTPLFPFGWGLSYTTFSFAAPEVSAKSVPLAAVAPGAAPVVTVKVKVTNTGAVAADDVVQLYLGVTGTSVSLPERELKAFRRIHLAKGESRDVTFALGYDELSYWDEAAHHVATPAHYRVWVGDSSLAEKATDFVVQ